MEDLQDVWLVHSVDETQVDMGIQGGGAAWDGRGPGLHWPQIL